MKYQQRRGTKSKTTNETNHTRQHIKYLKYLTPEKRNYWWRFNTKTLSIKKTESKFKRDKEGNLIKTNCPICNNPEEKREHYEYDFPQLNNFQKKLSVTIGNT